MSPLEKSLQRYPEARDLFEEGFSRSLQAAATEFKKLHEPKVAKFKGGYSSDASLIFQSWLKDIRVYTIEHCLSQREAIQLVKDYTSEQARSEVEYYLGLTPEEEQSFQGLIDHLSLAFQSCETVSSLIADFYNRFQKTRETKDAFADELQILVRKIIARKPEFIHEANQALKYQYAQNLRDPYFGVVARGQCLSSPDSEIRISQILGILIFQCLVGLVDKFRFLGYNGVCVVRIMGYAIGGGSYSTVYYHHLFMCSLWSLCYIFFHFFSFLCSVYSFLYPLVPLCFLFPICVFFSRLDENFWGVWVHMYYMQPHTCVLKWVYT